MIITNDDIANRAHQIKGDFDAMHRIERAGEAYVDWAKKNEGLNNHLEFISATLVGDTVFLSLVLDDWQTSIREMEVPLEIFARFYTH